MSSEKSEIYNFGGVSNYAYFCTFQTLSMTLDGNIILSVWWLMFGNLGVILSFTCVLYAKIRCRSAWTSSWCAVSADWIWFEIHGRSSAYLSDSNSFKFEYRIASICLPARNTSISGLHGPDAVLHVRVKTRRCVPWTADITWCSVFEFAFWRPC